MMGINEKAGGIIFSIRVQPRAAKNQIVGEHGDALKLRIAAPPVEGAANEACIRFLAEYFGVKRAQVSILSGATSQNKTVRIDGLTRAEALRKLSSEYSRKEAQKAQKEK